MSMDDAQSDEQLLQCARAAGDRAAFDSLIRRYANLVYGIAMRQTRDAQLAADISQAVFIVFVRRIGSIHHARALPGWFLKTTRFAVRDARRSAERRRFHEQQAAASRTEPTMSQNNPDQAAELAVIDDAIASLGRTDRDLVLMRYLQGRDFAVIAATLGITEPAVRKRLGRAIERMRKFFNANGAALSGVGVAGLLGSATTIVAPAAVVEGSVVAAVAGGAASSSAAAAIAKGVIQIMVWTKTKVAVGVAAAVALAITGGIVVNKLSNTAPSVRATTIPAVVAEAEVVPTTFEEADAQMRMNYGLADGEVIRFVPRPFIVEREVWLRTQRGTLQEVRPASTLTFHWTPVSGLKVTTETPDGPSLLSASTNLGFKWYALEGIERIRWRNPDGDLVLRIDAPQPAKIAGLTAFINRFSQAQYKFVTTSRERTCVVVNGETHPPSAKMSNGYSLAVVSLTPPDPSLITQLTSRDIDPGYEDAYDLDELDQALGVPVFQNGRPSVLITFVIRPEARLKESDPQLENKLRLIIDNLQAQVGGEWRIEKRFIQSYGLDPKPATHPSGRVINNYLTAARDTDAIAASKAYPDGNVVNLSQMREILRAEWIECLEYICADDSDGLARSQRVIQNSRFYAVYFRLKNVAGQWKITQILFPGDPAASGIRERFLREHPLAGDVRPAWTNEDRVPLPE